MPILVKLSSSNPGQVSHIRQKKKKDKSQIFSIPSGLANAWFILRLDKTHQEGGFVLKGQFTNLISYIENLEQGSVW